MKNLLCTLGLAILVTACGPRQVVNNTGQSGTHGAEAQPYVINGTINGGGGKGVLCQKNGQERLEVLDIYEGHELYQREYALKVKDEAQMREIVLEKVARHFAANDEAYLVVKKQLDTEYLAPLMKNIKFTKPGQRLNFVPDSNEPLVANGCRPVQLAIYYDESVLLIDSDYWKKLDGLNRTGLIMHELVYHLARQRGQVTSVQSRKLVGALLSTKPPKAIFSGIPRTGFLYCHGDTEDGLDTIHFAVQNVKEEKFTGVELLFYSFSVNVSLFRSTARIESLDILNFLRPSASETYHYADITQEGYSAPIFRAGFMFNKAVEKTLPVLLKNPKSEATAKIYKMKCEPGNSDGQTPEVKNDFSEQFFSVYGDGNFTEAVHKGRLSINKEKKTITVLDIRQVGREDDPVVPYPTVCSFVVESQINFVSVREDMARQEYMPYASHVLSYTPIKLTLVDELEKKTSTNPACLKWAARELNRQGLNRETLYFEAVDENSIRLHTSGGGDYDPKVGRKEGDSTMDELFKRE